MKLAQLILPANANKGVAPEGFVNLPERMAANRRMDRTHELLKQRLLDDFGGYTETRGQGAWKPPEGRPLVIEPVVVYQIAMERQSVIRLREIARDCAIMADQECVMIVTPCGDVEFVKPN